MSSEIQLTDIVIVIPIYRDYLLEDEIFAIRHLTNHLSNYHCVVASPEGLNLPAIVDDFQIEFFAPHYFSSIEGYNALMLTSGFYERFNSYKYMLIYQLDALVFSDQLINFCQMGWDYIGAPWFVDDRDPNCGFLISGNGGLSLRKINSFLNVLSSTKFQTGSSVRNFVGAMNSSFELWERNNILRFLKRVNIARKVSRGVEQYLRKYKWNEDRFWAFQAILFYPSFAVAPADVGLKFSFEQHPEYCFLRNNKMLPFGCHAWYRYNRDFWKDYLEYE